MKMPKLTLAQRGAGDLQSAHVAGGAISTERVGGGRGRTVSGEGEEGFEEAVLPVLGHDLMGRQVKG